MDGLQPLRAVDLEFLERAPARHELVEPVRAPATRVFAAISADPSTWTWFPGLDEGGYEGDGRLGVGARRWVRMGEWTYRETILAWDAPHRWAYRVDETSSPMFRALLEDWRIDATGAGAAQVGWTFAIDPAPGTEPLLDALPQVLGDVFRGAMQGLDAYLAAPPQD